MRRSSRKRSLTSGVFTTPGDSEGDQLALLKRYRAERTYTDKDSWATFLALVLEVGIHIVDEDAPHTGCCKAVSLLLLLRPEYEAPCAAIPCQGPEQAFSSNSTTGTMPIRKAIGLPAHVTQLRALLSSELDAAELSRLRSSANTNRSGYLSAISLADAKRLVAMSFEEGRALGHSMSPIWLEEWETSVICAHYQVVCVELHGASSSNGDRSHVQIVYSSSEQASTKLADDTELVFLRRIKCHYHAVWIGGKGRWCVGDLPVAARAFLGI